MTQADFYARALAAPLKEWLAATDFVLSAYWAAIGASSIYNSAVTAVDARRDAALTKAQSEWERARRDAIVSREVDYAFGAPRSDGAYYKKRMTAQSAYNAARIEIERAHLAAIEHADADYERALAAPGAIFRDAVYALVAALEAIADRDEALRCAPRA